VFSDESIGMVFSVNKLSTVSNEYQKVIDFPRAVLYGQITNLKTRRPKFYKDIIGKFMSQYKKLSGVMRIVKTEFSLFGH
jgi:hypothetical protein